MIYEPVARVIYDGCRDVGIDQRFSAPSDTWDGLPDEHKALYIKIAERLVHPSHGDASVKLRIAVAALNDIGCADLPAEQLREKALRVAGRLIPSSRAQSNGEAAR